MAANDGEHPAHRLLAAGADLTELEEAARGCTACPLYQRATQVVFGSGDSEARIVLVGEQPGDAEDREGEPFVGPAGRILDRALDAAGIDCDRTYVTNAVKHFKWTESGGWRRLHAKPNRAEMAACRPWLEAEMARLHPRMIVGLGATACQSMLGPGVRVTRHRGEVWDWDGRPVLITVHPSSLLRAGDDEERRRGFEMFVADLRTARGHLEG